MSTAATTTTTAAIAASRSATGTPSATPAPPDVRAPAKSQLDYIDHPTGPEMSIMRADLSLICTHYAAGAAEDDDHDDYDDHQQD